MSITKKSLLESVESLSNRFSTITGNEIKYKLFTGDARLGRIYAIGYENTGMTITSFMSAKELNAYIWGMNKASDILESYK